MCSPGMLISRCNRFKPSVSVSFCYMTDKHLLFPRSLQVGWEVLLLWAGLGWAVGAKLARMSVLS